MKERKSVSKIGEYPECTSCHNAMVFSFAIRGNEWVCLPCYEGVGMFNSRKKLTRTIKYMDAKKKKWNEELSILARRFGGGTCAICDDYSCDLCIKTLDKSYQFKICKQSFIVQ